MQVSGKHFVQEAGINLVFLSITIALKTRITENYDTEVVGQTAGGRSRRKRVLRLTASSQGQHPLAGFPDVRYLHTDVKVFS